MCSRLRLARERGISARLRWSDWQAPSRLFSRTTRKAFFNLVSFCLTVLRLRVIAPPSPIFSIAFPRRVGRAEEDLSRTLKAPDLSLFHRTQYIHRVFVLYARRLLCTRNKILQPLWQRKQKLVMSRVSPWSLISSRNSSFACTVNRIFAIILQAKLTIILKGLSVG
jgi:hypothetical protein